MRNVYGWAWLAVAALSMVAARAEQATETLIRVNCASGFERYSMVREIRRSIDHVMEFNPDIPNARRYAPIYQSQHRRYTFVRNADDAPGILGKMKSYLDGVFHRMQVTPEERAAREADRVLREGVGGDHGRYEKD